MRSRRKSVTGVNMRVEHRDRLPKFLNIIRIQMSGYPVKTPNDHLC